MDADSQSSFDTVITFMKAMGRLMADDMVWHHEGDKGLPWIHGDITGKEVIFEFLPVFSSNLQTTKWENADAFASGDTVTVFGGMPGTATKTRQSTGGFAFAPKRELASWSLGTGSKTVSRSAKRIMGTYKRRRMAAQPTRVAPSGVLNL